MLPDFAKPLWMVLVMLIFFGLITGRYFLFAGTFYLIFYVWFHEKWKTRKINLKKYKAGQLKIEVKWSMISAFLFSLAGTATIILWQKGYTRVYTDFDQYGWWYLPVSLIIFMLLHETYYSVSYTHLTLP